MLTEEQAVTLLRERVDKARTQGEFAAQVGVPQSFLSDVLKKRRPLNDKLLAVLKLKRVTMYEDADAVDEQGIPY